MQISTRSERSAVTQGVRARQRKSQQKYDSLEQQNISKKVKIVTFTMFVFKDLGGEKTLRLEKQTNKNKLLSFSMFNS